MGPPLGLSRGTVSVVPHDPRWGEDYGRAATELGESLGDWIVAVAHIGSTAVPGLDAKPIIDLMIAVQSLQLPPEVFLRLSAMGYAQRPDRVPGRLFFARGEERARTHYLSICESDSPFWTVHLAFRDLLRNDGQLAADYAALKHRLAAQFPDDRSAYTSAKEGFIRAALSIISHD